MKKIAILLVALFVFSTACGAPGAASSPSVDAQIGLMECEYSYDIDIPEQAAYYNDYIFAATVVRVLGQYDPYAEPEYVEAYGEVPVYDPCFTKYQLQVTQIIKGNLQVGDTVNARKMGYYDQDDQMYYMVENDVMPEEGREYLFLSNNRMQDNVHGINHAIPLEPSGAEISTYALTDEKPDRQAIIDRYTEAYANEVPYEPPIDSTYE